MMTVTQNHQLAFDFKNAGHEALDVFNYPMLVLWIQQLMPELLNESKRSASLLEAIYHFLFQQKKAVFCSHLEVELKEELYLCLVGLKTTLKSQQHNWNATKTYFDEHQKLMNV